MITTSAKVVLLVFIALQSAFLSIPGHLFSAPPGEGSDEEAVSDPPGVDGGDGDSAPPRLLGFDTGMNGGYSKGVAAGYAYYQYFAHFLIRHPSVNFTAGGSRYWDYQITNGAGDYEKVNFTQPRIALSVHPHRTIGLYGEYRYAAGDRSHYYRSHDGTAGLTLDFDVVSIDCYVNRKKTEYVFKSDDARNFYDIVTANSRYIANPALLMIVSYRGYKRRNTHYLNDMSINPTFSVYVHETTSIDFGYSHTVNDFEYLLSLNRKKTERYYVNMGRAGVYSDPWKHLSINAGVSAGKDSEGYTIAGGDLGLVVTILEYVRLSGSYAPEYYITPPPKYSRSAMRFMEAWALWNLVRFGNSNPYSRLSNIAKSFWNHGVSFGMTFTY